MYVDGANSAWNFSLATDATQLIHRACAKINNLPRGHSPIPNVASLPKPASYCDMYHM